MGKQEKIVLKTFDDEICHIDKDKCELGAIRLQKHPLYLSGTIYDSDKK